MVTLASCYGGLDKGGADGQSAKYTVTGTIEGPGQGNATLTLEGSGLSRTTTSDASGGYQFLNVPVGSYTLSAAQKGFAYTPSSQGVQITSADLKAEPFASVAAQETYSVSGTVTTSVKSGVLLTLEQNGATTGTAYTNSSGEFLLAGLANGTYTLTPSLHGYAFTPPSRSVTVSGAAITAQDFEGKVEAYDVSGSVSGEVNAGVAISLVGYGETLNATSDASGAFLLSNVKVGSYTMTAALKGFTFAPASRTVTVAKAALTGQNFGGLKLGWSSRVMRGGWTLATMSDDAKFLAVTTGSKQLYTSNDYGVNWANKSSALPISWSAMAMSQDGKYFTAMLNGGRLYTSKDFGGSWQDKSAGDISGERNWKNIAMSGDGKYQVALVEGGHLYASNDYGDTWKDKSKGDIASNMNWKGIAMSNDGKYVAAAVSGGHVYTSDDFGENWKIRNTGKLGTPVSWSAIAMSSDGKFLAAAYAKGHVYTSDDFGNSWQDSSSSVYPNGLTWASINISDDGKTLAGHATSGLKGFVYMSKDKGVTWKIVSLDASPEMMSFSSTAMSSDGNYLVAPVYGDRVYTYASPVGAFL